MERLIVHSASAALFLLTIALGNALRSGWPELLPVAITSASLFIADGVVWLRVRTRLRPEVLARAQDEVVLAMCLVFMAGTLMLRLFGWR